MKYLNIKTGNVRDIPGFLGGENWVPYEPDSEEENIENVEVETEPDSEEEPEQETEIFELEDDLEQYTIADLKEIALEFNIDLTGAKTKPEIIGKIESSGKF